MEYQICRLGASDFEEAIDFINLVFSMNDHPMNFIELLPVYYQPTEERMRCHHAIKTDGKIRALVGIYPADLIVGEKTLKIARIGAVSSHPYFRGQGFMKELVSFCVDLNKREGYDLGFLTGLRQRYLYFGYEKCGYKFEFHFNKNSIKHCGIESSDLEIKQVFGEDKTLIRYFKSLHDNQIMHVSRSEDDFYSICMNWENRLYGIFEQSRALGYMIFGQNRNHISEIHTENVRLTVKSIAAFIASGISDEVTLSTSPIEQDLCHELGRICNSVEIKDIDNWCIYNWEKVISAYLQTKISRIPLQDGRVILGIKEYGNLCICVSDGVSSCVRTQEAATLNVEPAQAARLLFGPLPPSAVVDLPKYEVILNSWCPLPLYLSEQDFA